MAYSTAELSWNPVYTTEVLSETSYRWGQETPEPARTIVLLVKVLFEKW